MSTAVDPIVPAAAPSGGRRFNPWAIAMTVTLATFMEVLDTSIANVALPHIAGNLSISQDESDVGADFLPGGERRHSADQRVALDASLGASVST